MQIKNQFAKPKYLINHAHLFSLYYCSRLIFTLFYRKARKQKEVGGVSFRRLKTLARKYVEELQDDEKESKKKNLDYIADSVKSSIKKFGIHNILLLFYFSSFICIWCLSGQDTARKLGEIADSPAMTTRNANNSNNNNNNNNSSKDSANVQAQLAELQKAVATIQAGYGQYKWLL